MTKRFPIWIVVGDAVRARLFEIAGPEQPLTEFRDLVHPEGRAREQDLLTDRPGRVMQAHRGPHPGHGSRSSMEPGTPPKEVERQRFARQIAEELQAGLDAHSYGRLVLVANPSFLGELREALSPRVTQHISASIHKDYTSLKSNELELHLKEHLI